MNKDKQIKKISRETADLADNLNVLLNMTEEKEKEKEKEKQLLSIDIESIEGYIVKYGVNNIKKMASTYAAAGLLLPGGDKEDLDDILAPLDMISMLLGTTNLIDLDHITEGGFVPPSIRNQFTHKLKELLVREYMETDFKEAINQANKNILDTFPVDWSEAEKVEYQTIIGSALESFKPEVSKAYITIMYSLILPHIKDILRKAIPYLTDVSGFDMEEQDKGATPYIALMSGIVDTFKDNREKLETLLDLIVTLSIKDPAENSDELMINISEIESPKAVEPSMEFTMQFEEWYKTFENELEFLTGESISPSDIKKMCVLIYKLNSLTALLLSVLNKITEKDIKGTFTKLKETHPELDIDHTCESIKSFVNAILDHENAGIYYKSLVAEQGFLKTSASVIGVLHNQSIIPTLLKLIKEEEK